MHFVIGGKSHVTFWRIHFKSDHQFNNGYVLHTLYAGTHQCHQNTYVTAIRWCSVSFITEANSIGVLFTGAADGSVQMFSLFAQVT